MSQPTNQNATWQPQLTGLGLPRDLTTGVSQVYKLVYSYRDQTDQTLTTLTRNLASLIQYGTQAARQKVAATSVPDGALWFETDTGNTLYQARIPSTTAAGPKPAEWVRLGTLA